MKLNLADVFFSNTILFSASSLLAQLATDPAGFNRIDCPGGSDTIVSIPFAQTAAFTGTLSASPSQVADGLKIIPEGPPSFGVNNFSTTPHYIRFLDDSAIEGSWYDVVANDTQSLTIDSRGEDLSSALAGDRFDVIPHWTLESVWPPNAQESLHVSTSKLLSGRESSVLFADNNASETDLAPNKVYFLTAEGWFQALAGFPAAGATVIPPGQSLVVRHIEGAEDTVFYTQNLVQRDDHRIWLRTSAAGPSDNHLGIPRPIPVALADLDLGPTAFVDSASTDPGDRKDELMLYDNADVSQNKVPVRVFFRVGGTWHEDGGASYPVSDDFEIEPSSGIVLRKSATLDGEPVLWVNSPRY